MYIYWGVCAQQCWWDGVCTEIPSHPTMSTQPFCHSDRNGLCPRLPIITATVLSTPSQPDVALGPVSGLWTKVMCASLRVLPCREGACPPLARCPLSASRKADGSESSGITHMHWDRRSLGPDSFELHISLDCLCLWGRRKPRPIQATVISRFVTASESVS